MLVELVNYLSVFGALCWWLLVLFPWRPWSTHEKIETQVHEKVILEEMLSDITVLIPARNEGPYIGHTLRGVRAQSENVHIIVIDDQSVDDTAEQARKCGAQVLLGTAPPAGWSGKLWALEQGLREVKTQYTLLLDADIELAPGIVSELQRKACNENLALVSLMAEPPMDNFIERLLMPAFILFFKLLYPFRLANKTESRVAAAAGGCILVKTQALRTTGAFANLHNALIDDCTLAAHIKRSGLRTFIGLSRAARSHRGYQKLKPIWEMVARTAFTQLRYSLVLLIICTLIMISMFWMAPFAFMLSTTLEVYIVSILTWAAMFFIYLPTLFYYQRSPLWAGALPVIGILYLAMTWTSALRYWRGERALWKDRRYESKTNT
ncbi:glycosyltransferase [Nitrosomonas supralitoralis]|uniref:Glycosyl transferase n=1 Tax=Nitrosomonas supralitoralis TaxID=2116706 RepID=A0A2P7NYM2_9PROT|nr:glycosyltransferase [Nitrosomonas supralitoralis]PSJ18573.1 glycosyl transferase [Nitrosomonas supralitoralis]